MPTFVKIAKNETTSTTGSFNFDNIPQTYTDLLLVFSSRNTANQATWNAACAIQFNNNASSVYGWVGPTNVNGFGGTSSNLGYTDFEGYFFSTGSGSSSNVFSNSYYYIPAYKETAANKTFFAHGAYPSGQVSASDASHYISGGSFRSTTAITSMTIFPVYGNFVAGSNFYLYGIGA